MFMVALFVLCSFSTNNFSLYLVIYDTHTLTKPDKSVHHQFENKYYITMRIKCMCSPHVWFDVRLDSFFIYIFSFYFITWRHVRANIVTTISMSAVDVK